MYRRNHSLLWINQENCRTISGFDQEYQFLLSRNQSIGSRISAGFCYNSYSDSMNLDSLNCSFGRNSDCIKKSPLIYDYLPAAIPFDQAKIEGVKKTAADTPDPGTETVINLCTGMEKRGLEQD